MWENVGINYDHVLDAKKTGIRYNMNNVAILCVMNIIEITTYSMQHGDITEFEFSLCIEN